MDPSRTKSMFDTRPTVYKLKQNPFFWLLCCFITACIPLVRYYQKYTKTVIFIGVVLIFALGYHFGTRP